MTPEPQDLATAPRDGTMVWLLVDYEDGAHALVDASRAWTIGHNNFDNDGEDVWQFAGWCWSHDHYTQGEGAVLAWSPIGFELEGPEGPARPAPCINHPDRPARTSLDGDDLCQDCADAWVRGEGDWQRYVESEEAGRG